MLSDDQLTDILAAKIRFAAAREERSLGGSGQDAATAFECSYRELLAVLAAIDPRVGCL